MAPGPTPWETAWMFSLTIGRWGRRMKSKYKFYLPLIPILALVFFLGCHSANNITAPVTPFQGTSLSISLPTGTISGALLGAASNEVYYQITGPAMQPVTGIAGPFSTSSNTGSVNFNVPVAAGLSRLMAFQLNDASNHQPLALGAVEMNITAQSAGPVTVEMGSVVRNCYNINTAVYNAGSYFTFETDALANAATVVSPTGYDVNFLPVTVGSTVGFQMNALGADTVAYLGNGNLVNFAAAPSGGYLASSGAAKHAAGVSVTLLQAGDIYCVLLGGGGHVWLQVISAGSASSGPLFFFRVNTTCLLYTSPSP